MKQIPIDQSALKECKAQAQALMRWFESQGMTSADAAGPMTYTLGIMAADQCSTPAEVLHLAQSTQTLMVCVGIAGLAAKVQS